MGIKDKINDLTGKTGSEVYTQSLSRAIIFDDGIISLTYAQLLSLKRDGRLFKGQKYRINNYETVTPNSLTDVNYDSNLFDLIVTADSETELNENANATFHSGTTYFNGFNIEAWEIKYDINNDVTKYEWADSSNGKGVIYYMKDEFGNEAPYDFKNIQFKKKVRYDSTLGVAVFDENGGTEQWLYTFTAYDIDNSRYIDAYKAIGKGADDASCALYGNTMKPYQFDYNTGSIQPYRLNENIFLNTFSDTDCMYFECYGNVIGFNSYNNTFGNYCGSNTFGNNCYGNTFGNNCVENTFGNYCYYNTFGNNCGSNTFGNGCWYNTFGNNCYGNTFGNNCWYNTFGNYCYYNTFGNNCYGNTFGNNCNYNTFGNNCNSNTFGNSFNYNTFGNYCYYNTFGNYVRYLTVNDGVTYCNFSTNYTTGSSNYLQNIHVLNGVSFTSLTAIPTGLTVNADFTQVVSMGENGVEFSRPDIQVRDIDFAYSSILGVLGYLAENRVGENFKLISNGKFYRGKECNSFELDFSNYEKVGEMSVNDMINLINTYGYLAFNGMYSQSCTPEMILGDGLYTPLYDEDSSSIKNITFSPGSQSLMPSNINMYIEKIEITAHSAYNSETESYPSVSVMFQCTDTHNTGYKFYSFNQQSRTYTVNRTDLLERRIEGEEETYVPISLDPLTSLMITEKEGGSNFGSIVIEKIKFFVSSGTGTLVYYANNDNEESEAEDYRESGPKDLHKITRINNNKVYVVDKEDSVDGYILVNNINDLTDGDYLIASSTSDKIMSVPDGNIDDASNCNIDRENNVIVPDDDYDEQYYEDREMTVKVNGNNISLYNKNKSLYFGYTGAKNGIETNVNDNFHNTFAFNNGVITITCEGSGLSTLKHNSGGDMFRFYKTGQTDIQLFKKTSGNPYVWKEIVKKEQLSTVAFTNDYNDLYNKPVIEIGDVQIYDYDILPKAGEAYNKILARNNNALYTSVLSEGFNFAPLNFAQRYPNISSSSASNQIREWFCTNLEVGMGMFPIEYFEIESGSTRISTSNTNTRGVQIGSSSNAGQLLIMMSDSQDRYPRVEFDSVTVKLEQYGNESSNTTIQIGTRNDNELVSVAEEIINFEYEIVETEIPLKNATVTLTSNTKVEGIKIATSIDEEGDRGRVVLKELIFNNLRRVTISEGTEYYLNFVKNYVWKPISGGSIKLINLL